MGRGGYARSRRPFRKSRESSHLGRGVCLIDPAVLLRIGNCVKFPVPAVIWYIDHIIPIRCYDLADPIDLKRVFNWRNTQVLTKEANMIKGASGQAVTHPFFI